ncbi:DMT family transporter [Patescibacteria group bacterium]|nr:DMT family transporter [Patescibacteria group bacterium]
MNIYLVLPAIAGVLWATIMILDRYMLEDKFKHPLQALVVSSILSLWGFVLVPFVERQQPSLEMGILAGLAGVLFTISYGFYFCAMECTDEPSEVALWDACSPVFIALFSIPLGMYLLGSQWIGVVVVCVGMFFLQIHKGKKVTELKWGYRSLNILNAVFIALSTVTIGYVLQYESYWNVYPMFLAGLCSGAIVICKPAVFRAFLETKELLWQYRWMLFANEFCGVLAVLCEGYAMQYCHPAAVATIASTYPAIIILAGPLLRFLGCSEKTFPKTDMLAFKILIFAICIAGIGLLAWE